MRNLLILSLTSLPLLIVATAGAETQSETIARVCNQYGQDSQECRNVSGNQLQLQLNDNSGNQTQAQSEDAFLDEFDRDLERDNAGSQSDEDVYSDDTCASGWRGMDSNQCTDG